MVKERSVFNRHIAKQPIFFFWTYKVSGLLAEQPHCGHALDRGVDVRQGSEQEGFVALAFTAGGRELQGDGRVRHPTTVVELGQRNMSGFSRRFPGIDGL